MLDLWRYFWIRETGTGQQVAQLHERYMIIIIIIIIIYTSRHISTTLNVSKISLKITYEMDKI